MENCGKNGAGWTRREFVAGAAAAVTAWRAGAADTARQTHELANGRRVTLAGNTGCVEAPGLKEAVRVAFVTDTHMAVDDARGLPFVRYSRRMGGTGAAAPGQDRAFGATLAHVKASEPDILLLGGDMVSFPSEAGVEFLARGLAGYGRAWLYVAGNHDWHYEGTEGSDIEQRAEWAPRRLAPLYQGADWRMAAREVKGVRFLAIDNSVYDVLPEQLDWFRAEVKTGRPLCLLMHIPLWSPTTPGEVTDYGCGNPRWCGRNDPYWEIERRQRWRAEGALASTRQFCKEAAAAENLVAVFTGHTHRRNLNFLAGEGTPQFTGPGNRDGAWMNVTLRGRGGRDA